MAIREAQKSRHRQHKHAAILMKGGKPIAAGHNGDAIHAEHAAINRAWRSGTEGATIIVIRVRKNGTMGMSKPCDACMNRLIEAGVKRVIYSDNDGTLKSFKVQSDVDVCSLSTTMQNILWNKKVI
jgi:deoxycytidylate deaminase